MRRIYESSAIQRDDDDQFTPGEREEAQPQAFRSIDSAAWSDRLLPVRLRRWAVTLSVTTPELQYQHGESVPFTVTFENRLPMPVTVPTTSPRLWQWTVDGYPEASHIEETAPPAGDGRLRLDRGETLRIHREWSQRFKTGGREWEPADPGTYTIGAALAVADPASSGLADEVTVQIVR